MSRRRGASSSSVAAISASMSRASWRETHTDVRCQDDRDRASARARAVADELSRTTVLLGDALEREILERGECQPRPRPWSRSRTTTRSTSLSSLLAKRLGAGWAITLVNSTSYGPLVGHLGVDVVVNPRGSTVSTILQHVRRGRIRGVYSVREGAGEFIEAEALDTSNIAGKRIRDMRLPKGILIGPRDPRRRGHHAAGRHRDQGTRQGRPVHQRRSHQEGREAVFRRLGVLLSRPRLGYTVRPRTNTHAGKGSAMSRVAYVNGRYLPHGEAQIHIDDRAHNFADGVYEVILVAGRKLIDQDGHMVRLARSLCRTRHAASR